MKLILKPWVTLLENKSFKLFIFPKKLKAKPKQFKTIYENFQKNL